VSETRDARLALLFELGDDLGKSLVLGWEEKWLRKIDPCRVRLAAEARDDVGEVDRDHGASVAQIRHNPLAATIGHPDLAGTFARTIMGGDEAALLRLWYEKRGEADPEDLSGNLIVQLGRATEHLNRQWYERTTGQAIKDVQSWVRHPVIRWMAATLDGIVEGSGAAFEAKFMLPWSFSEEMAAERHMAQLQHNMWVTNATAAALSIKRFESRCSPWNELIRVVHPRPPEMKRINPIRNRG